VKWHWGGPQDRCAVPAHPVPALLKTASLQEKLAKLNIAVWVLVQGVTQMQILEEPLRVRARTISAV